MIKNKYLKSLENLKDRVLLLFFISLFSFYSFNAFGQKKSSSSNCSKVLKIVGAKDFYIIDPRSSKPLRIKRKKCLPLNSSFELPKDVSLKLRLDGRSLVFVNGGSHVRVSKLNQSWLLKVSVGTFRIYLKRLSNKKKLQEKKEEGIYIETTDVVTFLKYPTQEQRRKTIYEYIFERTPLRTAVYSLKGFVWVAENRDQMEEKVYYSKLKSKEYSYGRLDQSLSFNKVRVLKKMKDFLNRFNKKNPGLKKLLR